ncbi:hypothetical protein BDZ89DRAFT_1230060 [Hymenopellis radicata]|nr:hypothetical protein BDZ89DRAFT_1230060 [Hymenopellis radicata]
MPWHRATISRTLPSLRSSYLLKVELTENVLTEEIAQLIAPEYLKRFLDMHHTRKIQLYDVLFEQLPQHAILAACGSSEHLALSRAWTLAAGSLIWHHPVPSLTEYNIRSVLTALHREVRCDDCKRMVLKRIDHIVAQWDNLKTTI